jgi:hypothetical protein
MWLHLDLHREIEVTTPLDTSHDANWEPVFAQPLPLGATIRKAHAASSHPFSLTILKCKHLGV